jgi:transposase
MRHKPPTMVVMPACYSSHYWGRQIAKLGHDSNLIPAQHVTPFVLIKTEQQQEVNCLHRIRERLIKNKTALSNQVRGLLSEFGVVFPCDHAALCTQMVNVIDNEQYRGQLRALMDALKTEYDDTRMRIATIELQLRYFVDNRESAKILLSIPGIGYLNTSVFLATIDKVQAFNTPTEFAVWLGITPKQHGSGDINKMGGITKRGDHYLRKQLNHGTRYGVHQRPVLIKPTLIKSLNRCQTTD